MSYNQPGLVFSHNSYYFRLRVPKRIEYLARSKEFRCSLDTSDYKEAIARWKKELAHLQVFLTVFEEVVMKINPENKLILEETDVDNVLLSRLGQIQYFLEENTQEIIAGKKTFNDIGITGGGKKTPAQIKLLMVQFVIEYLKSLVENGKANITLRTIYSKLKEKEIELGVKETNEKGYNWFKSFSNHIGSLDRYAKNSIRCIKEDKPYSPSNPKVKTLLGTYDAVKTNERLRTSMARTPWEKFFKRFSLYKKNIKDTKKEQIERNYVYLKICFFLIKKEYIEDITKFDCRRLSERIHTVPKNWQTLLRQGKSLDEILSKGSKKKLAMSTIKSYLQTFKEFMRYSVKEDIIEHDLNIYIDMPIKGSKIEREPFTGEELRTIFNIKTYPNPHLRRNAARFWVPIIALYHGCRLNEICQMDLDDVIVSHQIPCFSINSKGTDKTLKNKSSERLLPIHPQLIKMGFLSYVHYQRKNKEKKLFNYLRQTKRFLYSHQVQTWFGRYLDEIGLDDPSKVFHSFRHTFATKAIERKIPTEYQNALGGWTDYGVGQRVYGHRQSATSLYRELIKIDYPIHREMKELEEAYRNSYIFKK